MPQTGIVYKISYLTRDGQLLLHLLGRDTESKRIDRLVSGAKPYCYVPKEEAVVARALPQVVDVSPGPPCTDGREMVKVTVRAPYDVPEIKDKFTFTAEADIAFNSRVRIDHGLSYVELPDDDPVVPLSRVKILDAPPTLKPRIAYFDLEVDDSKDFATTENAFAAITAVSVYYSKSDVYGCIWVGKEIQAEDVLKHLERPLGAPLRLFPVKNEHDLIGAFGMLLRKMDPDIAEAWNGAEYDFDYLAERAKRLIIKEDSNDDIQLIFDCFDENARQSHGRFAIVDPMAVRKKQELKQKENSLQAVGMEVLGFGKVSREGTVADLMRKDPARWVAYNIWDSHLMRLVDQKLDYTGYAAGITLQMGCELESLYFNSRPVDGMLLSFARINGQPELCLPSKVKRPFIRKGKAAEVFSPLLGIYDGVIAIDLAQEYPSIMMTFNIGPETRRTNAVPLGTYDLPTGGHYIKTPLGITRRALVRFREIRNEAKKVAASHPVGSPERERAETLSTAIKFVVNSVAGVYDDPHWRCVSVETFEDITGMARLQLKWNRDHVVDEKWLSGVLGGRYRGTAIMGDTDSCYFKVDEFVNGAWGQVIDYDRLVSISSAVVKALNASYGEFFRPYGVTEHFTEIELEGIFERFRTLPLAGSDEGAKKRYFGLYSNKAGVDVRGLPFEKRLKISGIEMKRFNVSPVAKGIQKEIVTMILKREEKAIPAGIKKLQDAVMAGTLDEELLIPAKLSGTEVNQPHVVAMANFKTYVGWPCRKGDAMRWAYVSSVKVNGEEIGVKAMAIPYLSTLTEMRKAGIEIALDRKAMLKKCVLDPAALVYPELAGTSADLGAVW